MLSEQIRDLVNYGIQNRAYTECERIYTTNLLLDLMKEDSYKKFQKKRAKSENMEEILSGLLNEAVKRGIIEDSITERDLFDTKLMNCLVPRPSGGTEKILGTL